VVRSRRLGRGVAGCRANRFAETIPNAGPVLFPGVRHNPHLEAPHLFHPAPTRFLRTEALPQGRIGTRNHVSRPALRKRRIAAIPKAGPGASSGNAQRQPAISTIPGTAWMVTMVSRKPSEVWSVSAAPRCATVLWAVLVAQSFAQAEAQV
jgi:hypothetical protein